MTEFFLLVGWGILTHDMVWNTIPNRHHRLTLREMERLLFLFLSFPCVSFCDYFHFFIFVINDYFDTTLVLISLRLKQHHFPSLLYNFNFTIISIFISVHRSKTCFPNAASITPLYIYSCSLRSFHSTAPLRLRPLNKYKTAFSIRTSCS